MPMATRGQGRMLLYPEDHREYELIPVTGAQCAAIVPGLASSLAQRARGRASQRFDREPVMSALASCGHAVVSA